MLLLSVCFFFLVTCTCIACATKASLVLWFVCERTCVFLLALSWIHLSSFCLCVCVCISVSAISFLLCSFFIEIYSATSAVRPRADVAYCIHALARRLAKTRSWIVNPFLLIYQPFSDSSIYLFWFALLLVTKSMLKSVWSIWKHFIYLFIWEAFENLNTSPNNFVFYNILCFELISFLSVICVFNPFHFSVLFPIGCHKDIDSSS